MQHDNNKNARKAVKAKIVITQNFRQIVHFLGIVRDSIHFLVDARSVETTISVGQIMQMCHSLRRKQIDKSTADDLNSIFPNKCRRHIHM